MQPLFISASDFRLHTYLSKAHTMLLSRRALIASSLLLASFAVLAAPKLARKPAAQVLPPKLIVRGTTGAAPTLKEKTS